MNYIIEEMHINIGSKKVEASIWRMDRNHILRAANLNALYFFRVSTYEELIGKTIFDLSHTTGWSLKGAQDSYYIDEMIMQKGIPDKHVRHVPPSIQIPYMMQFEWLKKPILNSEGNTIGLDAALWVLCKNLDMK